MQLDEQGPSSVISVFQKMRYESVALDGSENEEVNIEGLKE